ncbi:DNA repair protein rad10 [Auriculariales sp. MPI-PUGE-AT-0066]|nr:DNA repair protein rad10 [Auriculariales sp. MPI-PUGE-AT-0066]
MSLDAAIPVALAAAPHAPPVVHTAGSGSSILVNTCQRGNPVLEHIKNVSKEWADIVPDFQIGRTACALFLSLKYHRLHPEYIHKRLELLGNAFTLRVLLVQCDITEHQDSLREITKLALIKNLTVIVAWSVEECGLYLSTFKVYEHKPPTAIRERIDTDHMSILRAALTGVRKVNKTDVVTLKTTFGSFAGISRATEEQLVKCPGVGQKKARRIHDAFNQPFYNRPTKAKLDTFVRPLNPVRNTQIPAGDMGPPPPPPTPSSSKTPAADVPARQQRPAREPSPDWVMDDYDNDDESENDRDVMDAQDDDDTPLNPHRRPVDDDDAPLNPRKRPPPSASPEWNIELDLNESSDDEQHAAGPAHKRLRPSQILVDNSDSDSD